MRPTKLWAQLDFTSPHRCKAFSEPWVEPSAQVNIYNLQCSRAFPGTQNFLAKKLVFNCFFDAILGVSGETAIIAQDSNLKQFAGVSLQIRRPLQLSSCSRFGENNELACINLRKQRCAINCHSPEILQHALQGWAGIIFWIPGTGLGMAQPIPKNWERDWKITFGNLALPCRGMNGSEVWLILQTGTFL